MRVIFLAVLGTVSVAAPRPWQAATRRVPAWLTTRGWPVTVYVASRLAIYLVAGTVSVITGRSLPGVLTLSGLMLP